ncbi:MAG TPA: MFS transporter [Ktedonobacteraceae bacterium]|nr:MFS transporter [Ktedonobacteraceae bacterium]
MNTTHRASKAITLLVTCLGTFMVLLDASIVNVALPTIQTDLHANLSDLQWTVDAYTLPFAALMLSAGTLGDRFGRKRLFLSGMVLFLLGSTFCGFAPTLGWLLFGRVVQGIGAGALSTGSLSVLASAFPDTHERARAIGIWAGISGMALAAGPLAGGLLIQIGSWPSIFFVNLPVGGVALALGWSALPESRNPHARRIDLPGQVLVTAALVCLIMALIESSSVGWTSPLILVLFIATIVLLAAFLLVEARASEPLLPLSLFANRIFSVALVAALLAGFVLMGTVFFIAQYFQSVQGYTALGSGLRTLPATMGMFLTAPIAGRLAARLGSRPPIVLGALLTASMLFLMTRIEPDTNYASIWWNLGLWGIGFGLMLSPITSAGLSATPLTRAGLGSSMLNTSRQIGVTLGVAILGTFVVQQFSSNIASQLSQRGIPGPTGAAIASKIATAGAQAGRLHLSGQLPLSQATLHQTINQAFVDSLHGSFLISGIALLISALLVASLLHQKQPQPDTSVPSTNLPPTTEPLAIQDTV